MRDCWGMASNDSICDDVYESRINEEVVLL